MVVVHASAQTVTSQRGSFDDVVGSHQSARVTSEAPQKQILELETQVLCAIITPFFFVHLWFVVVVVVVVVDRHSSTYPNVNESSIQIGILRQQSSNMESRLQEANQLSQETAESLDRSVRVQSQHHTTPTPHHTTPHQHHTNTTPTPHHTTPPVVSLIFKKKKPAGVFIR